MSIMNAQTMTALTTTSFPPAGGPKSAACTPEPPRPITGHQDGTIKSWTVPDLKETASPQCSGQIYGFASDGKSVAFQLRNSIEVRSLADGRLISKVQTGKPLNVMA